MQTPIAKRELLAGTLPAGTQLRNYQLISHLATGGMAELYLARAIGIENFERLVVIKRILPQWARDPQFVAMFLDEARLAAQLRHPNIAQVFDIGEDSGAYFFAMEFVHGEDLRTLLRQNQIDGERLPLELAISIVIETASALHHAHEAADAAGNSLELVHRDVSPSNVLLSYDGAVKVVDFGIAKAANRQQETRTGTLKGKISYMSPEQCCGEDVNRRADVFALGILLYEATTGRRLFDGKTDFITLQQITQGQIRSPRTHVPGYPEELEAILNRALAVDREIRYQTAESLASHLEVFAAKEGLPLSRRQLSRYLRERFANKLDAWERARSQGKSLAAHMSALYTLTPSGVSRSRPSMPRGTRSGEPRPAADPEPGAPVPSRGRRMPVLLMLLATAILTAAFVALVMPRLGWGPANEAEISAPDLEAARTRAQLEVAARRRAEAEARAAAEARARAAAEAKAAEATAAVKTERQRLAELQKQRAELEEQAAERKRRRARKSRRDRRRDRDSASGSRTSSSWQANSPLLPSRVDDEK